jgi:putative radical SAM enzyme (TIGR03279 family)
LQTKEIYALTVKNENNRRISEVHIDSIAEALGIVPGDILLSIDGEDVADIFDYRMRVMSEKLTITLRRADGSLLDAQIEKDEDDDLGLSFEEPLLDMCSSCHNSCIFCFIDQLPKGMRPSLYFKDDDLRMSFLTGNYVTLTNLSDAEFDRILSYRLSPMNVSVHASDPKVRENMMRSRFAGNIMKRLRQITEAGISLNCQIVLCPGVNDADVLNQTITDLSTLGENLCSIAVVPVGITKFREQNHLTRLSLFDKETASAVLDLVCGWQKYFIKTRKERIFFAADEFFLRAERPIPKPSWYEGFPQLENGVGLLSEFRHQLTAGLSARRRQKVSISTKNRADMSSVMVLSGVDAAPFLNSFADQIEVLYNISLGVKAVVNCFFGETITVTGLLTGQDIVNAVEADRSTGGKTPDVIFLPDCTLKADEDVFLDDMTVNELRDKLSLPVVISRSTGEGMLEALDEYTGLFVRKGRQRSPKRGNENNE